MKTRNVFIALTFLLFSAQASAASCPIEYLDRYQDERSTKTGEYWIIVVQRHSWSTLNSVDLLATYNKLLKERSPDLKCTLKRSTDNPAIYQFSESQCTNIAGYSWNHSRYQGLGETSGYVIDEKGSSSLEKCDGYCEIYIDKSGNKFITDSHNLSQEIELVTPQNKPHIGNVVILKDGSIDMERIGLKLGTLFNAGDKKYVTIGREVERGFFCKYQGGVSPNI